jgi:hypothetical protein
MGAAVGAACFADAGQAADFYYSAVPPRLTDQGYSVFEKSGNTWALNTYHNGQLTATSPVTPNFASCDVFQQTTDGITLGWWVIFPAVIAWSIKVLRRAL